MTEKIKVTGSPTLTEHPIFGERVTLIVHGSFDRRAQTVDDHGTITETYTFTVEDVADPGEELLEAAYERIEVARDRINGGTRLPLDEAIKEFVEKMDAVAGEGNWSIEVEGVEV